jgi:hypothetical protein
MFPEQDAPTAESSSAQAVEETPAGPPIEEWSAVEYRTWRETGERPPAKKAEAPPASKTESSAAAEKPAEKAAPAPEAGNPQEQPKRKTGEDRKAELSAEIQELLRQRHQLRDEVSRMRPQKDEKQPDPSAGKPQQTAATTDKPKAPKSAEYKTWGEYEDALAEYQDKLTDWKLAERDRAHYAAQQEESRRELKASWSERVAEHSKSDTDFQDAIEYVGPFATAAGVADLIMQSEVGPQIVSYLHQHQDEAVKIAQSGSPVAIAAAIGKLEAKLLGERKPAAKAAEPVKPVKAPEPKKTTSAAPPPTELAAKSGGAEDEAAAALRDRDFARYKRVMDAREKR